MTERNKFFRIRAEIKLPLDFCFHRLSTNIYISLNEFSNIRVQVIERINKLKQIVYPVLKTLFV
jgi:hypothetical protein